MKKETFRKGQVKMELSGSHPERFLNLCSLNHIPIKQLERREDTYRFQASCQDVEEMADYARKANVRLILCRERSTATVWRRGKKRMGYVMGMILCGLLLFALSQCIWVIRFEGNSKYTKELLQKTLAENGYYVGMRKNRIHSEELEQYLRQIYPDINWVSVEVSGDVLTVQIKENTGVLTVAEEDNSPCNLLAEEDGQIVSIVTRAGTPCVAVGDTVKAGDILVSGVIPLINDDGEETGVNLTHADADIIAQTEEHISQSFSLLHETKWYTGQCRYQLSVHLFGRDWFLDGNRYGLTTYDTVSETGDTFRLLGFTVPIAWEKRTLMAYQEIEGIYSQEEAEEKAEEKLNQIFINLFEKGVQIIEKDVRIDTMDGICMYTVDLTLQQPIGVEQIIDESQYTREDADDS